MYHGVLIPSAASNNCFVAMDRRLRSPHSGSHVHRRCCPRARDATLPTQNSIEPSISGHAVTDNARQTAPPAILSSTEAQLFVADIKASCGFYTDKLGFTTQPRAWLPKLESLSSRFRSTAGLPRASTAGAAKAL
ncbi:MAG: hypothetical protein ACR2KT_09560 [Methylocella sp.]